MRLFFAIPLDETVRRHLGKVRDSLRTDSAGAKINWTPDENFHITVKFLGNVTDQQTVNLCHLMCNVPLGNPFSLRLAGADFFPPRGHPSVIIATLNGDLPAAANLAAVVEQACRQLSFPLERRKFIPHITLGRIRQTIARFAATNPIPPVSFPIEQIQLMQSDPGPQGAIYRRVAQFPFGGAKK